MSDTAGYIFTESATRQVAQTVRTVQGQRVDLTSQSTEKQLAINDEVWVKITGNLDGGGHYEGQILLPPTADISPSSNAAAADFGAPHAPAYGKLYIQNSPEIGTTRHSLSAGRICKGTVIRRQTDDTVWVSIESYDFFTCETA